MIVYTQVVELEQHEDNNTFTPQTAFAFVSTPGRVSTPSRTSLSEHSRLFALEKVAMIVKSLGYCGQSH